MAKLPAFQFYPGDWLRDSVAGCSLAAQGLWLRMLFVMHDGTPYGHLAKHGKPIPLHVLFAMAGTTEEQAAPLLAELDALGVFDRTADGIIFSRRMVRDQRARDQARARKAAERERERGVTLESRSCHGDVTPMSQPSSVSTSSSDQDSSSCSREADEAAADQLGDNIRLLMSIGMGTGDATRWAKHPNATPERVRFLVAKAASGAWEGRAVAMVCAGIRDGWDVPAAEADTVKAKAARILAGSQKARKAAS